MALFDFLSQEAAAKRQADAARAFGSDQSFGDRLRGFAGIAGSALGLPEFGVSEARALEPVSTFQPSIAPPAQLILPQSGPTRSLTPTQTTTPTEPTGDGGQSIDHQLLDQINAAAASKLGFLGEAEGRLREAFPSIQGDITAQFGASKGSLEAEKARGGRELGAATTGAEQRGEDVTNAARRLFNELRIGGRQRFGGATSAGDAFSELSSREFQRNRAQIAQNLTNSLQQIQAQKVNLNETFGVALANLEVQKNIALNDAQRGFDDRLFEIDRLRAETESDKANMKLAALQDLRNQIFQINLVEAQLRTSATTQKAQAEQELENAFNLFNQSTAAGQSSVSNLIGATTTSPETKLAISRGTGTTAPALTGIRDEEELRGTVAPTRREDLFGFA